ncbi:MAG: glycerol kinase GlpK [Betaproteobacteria bacterium]|jgi:glycerol kinase|nr:glycerol kinase GlpK [Betaproteobacteria bacterium]
MSFVLALDQGTTSSRAIVFDEHARSLGVTQSEFPQLYPRPGWVEHDPEEIWRTQMECARGALEHANVKAADLAAIGITNQRETALIWDRATGKPIHNAIVWQDRRTAEHCERLRQAGHEALVRSRTGLVIDPYFSATKIAWLLEHVAGARTRAEAGKLAFGTIDTWLMWKLTGGALHVTDVSNASRTMLYDIVRGEWDAELLDLLGVPRAILPEVRPSSGDFGQSDADLLGARVRIAGVAGDQQAALFGQGCHAPGMAKNTYGTGCFMLLHCGGERIVSQHGLVTTRAAEVDAPEYALEGSVFVAGAVVQWLRDGLRMIKASVDIEELAGRVPDAGGVFFVPAFVGLGAPHWDPHARGTIVGLTRGSTEAHIARAALESIAFQSAEVLGAMQQDAGTQLSELRVDGGAAANDLLMQFQADLLGVPVVRPRVLETTALGAAYLAGIATGVWRDRREIAAQWRAERRFVPTMARDESGARIAHWRRAVERARGWEQP